MDIYGFIDLELLNVEKQDGEFVLTFTSGKTLSFGGDAEGGFMTINDPENEIKDQIVSITDR